VNQKATAELNSHSPIWERARPLAFGQTLLSVESNYTMESTRFLNNGQQQSLGSSLTQNVNWLEISDLLKNQSDQLQIQAYLQEQGIDSNETAATLEYQIKREKLKIIPFWSHGLTSKWTLGLRVPVYIVKTHIKISSHMQNMSNKNKKLNKRLTEKISQGAEQLSDTQLAKNDFDHVSAVEERTLLGDVQLMSKYNVFHTKKWWASLKQEVIFPSGISRDQYEYVDTMVSDGQFDVGLGGLVDWEATSNMNLHCGFNYRWQLPDRKSMRVPKANDLGTVHSSIENNVERNLGDIKEAQFNASYRLMDSWVASGGYNYQYKDKDVYKGKDQSSEVYKLMSENTDSEIHILRLGLSFYNEIKSLRRGVRRQLSAHLNYFSPLSGRNHSADPVTEINLLMMF